MRKLYTFLKWNIYVIWRIFELLLQKFIYSFFVRFSKIVFSISLSISGCWIYSTKEGNFVKSFVLSYQLLCFCSILYHISLCGWYHHHFICCSEPVSIFCNKWSNIWHQKRNNRCDVRLFFILPTPHTNIINRSSWYHNNTTQLVWEWRQWTFSLCLRVFPWPGLVWGWCDASDICLLFAPSCSLSR